MKINSYQEAAVAAWNRSYPIGLPVRVERDNSEALDTETCSGAQMVGDRAVIWVKGIAGCYALDRVTPRAACPDDTPPSELVTHIETLVREIRGSHADGQYSCKGDRLRWALVVLEAAGPRIRELESLIVRCWESLDYDNPSHASLIAEIVGSEVFDSLPFPPTPPVERDGDVPEIGPRATERRRRENNP
jgi:hypothetical protein